MNIIKENLKSISASLFGLSVFLLSAGTSSAVAGDCVNGYIEGSNPQIPCIGVGGGSNGKLPFIVPSLSDILTFGIRLIFIIGGLAALFFLLLGAFAWITSGGDKDKVSAAQQKIQAAVIGVIMIAVVLAIVVTLEKVIFAGSVCLGISCPITIPALLQPQP